MPETTGQTIRNDAPSDSGTDRQELVRRIARGVAKARLALFWEDMWPRLIWPLGVLLIFVAASWLGLWTLLPDIARLAGLIVFGAVFLASLWAFRGVHFPGRADGLARLERVSGYQNRPLHTLEDALPIHRTRSPVRSGRRIAPGCVRPSAI